MEDLHQIDERFAPDEVLDQGATGTCYGHAAHYLLQYFYNQQQERQGSSQKSNLSLLNLLEQGCNQEFREGDNVYRVLNELKGASLTRMNHGELHVEDFKKVVEICKHHPRAHLDPLYHQIKNIMGDLDDIKDFIKSQWIDEKIKPEPFAFALARKAGQGSSVTLPNYDVNIIQSSPSTRVFDHVTDVLSKSVPISVTFGEDRTTKHAVAIIGSRKLCCGPTSQRECKEEWKIQNSYGPASTKQGWLDATRFINSKPSFLYISDPQVPTNAVGKSSINNEIEEQYYQEYLKLNAKDREKKLSEWSYNLDLLVSRYSKYFLFRAAQGGDLKLIKEILDTRKEVQPDQYRGFSVDPNPIDGAISKGQAEIVEELLNSGFEPSYGSLGDAISLGDFEMVRLLIEQPTINSNNIKWFSGIGFLSPLERLMQLNKKDIAL